MLAACSGGGNIDIGSGQKRRPGRQIDFPIAYVKRNIPDPLRDDLRNLRTFLVDADVYVKDRADASVAERNITDRITGTGTWDVRDLDVSADGRKLVFAMRGPFVPNADEEDQPTWNIWEYTFGSDTLQSRGQLGASSRRKATTSRRTTCPTAASCSPRPASAPPRPCCSTRASRSSTRRPRTGASRPSSCT